MICMDENLSPEALKRFRTDILRLKQREIAAKIGVSLQTYANWESRGIPPKVLPDLKKLGFGLEAKEIPHALQLYVPMAFIGLVSANDKTMWCEPEDTDSIEFVPPEMGESKGRFAAKIESDCMFPLLEPGDIVVFQQDRTPKLNRVVIWKTFDGRITVKHLKHNGAAFLLHPLNPSYEDHIAEGECVGYLVGIVRTDGRRRQTDYDPDGIRP
jgi:DNA-binding XRE family transcriptional regulator